MTKLFQKILPNVVPAKAGTYSISARACFYRFRIKCGMTGNDLKSRGFSLVEIIIAIGVAAIFIPAIGIALSFAIQSTSQGEKFSQAYALAQEGMEKIFSQKSTDPSWQWNAVNITTTTIPNTLFTRQVEIADSFRCGTDSHLCDCLVAPVDPDCPGIIDDEATRKVIVTISWPEKGENREVKLEAYVTKH